MLKKLDSIFLLSILLLGIANTPSAFLNLDNDSKLAFAQTDEADQTDEQTDDEDTEEQDDEAEDETDETENEEIEIDVEIYGNTAEVKVKINGEESEFEVKDFQDRAEIIQKIIDETGLTEEQIMSVIEFEVEDEDNQKEEKTRENAEDRKEKMKEKAEERKAKAAERQAELEQRLAEKIDDPEKLAKIMQQRETKALERAQDTIKKLEEKIQQLENRLQNLLEKIDTGEYYGPVAKEFAVKKTYDIVIEGTAQAVGNREDVQDMKGEIFVETLVLGDHYSKLRITGGDIVIGDTLYELAFGKARASSSGTSGEKSTIVLIVHANDGDTITTTKLLLGLDMPVGEIGSEPASVEILSPQSKIAHQWFLSGTGEIVQQAEA